MDTYEKKYNEALSKCKAYIDDTEKRWSEEFSRATEEVFKEIFPELRESKDERIRKVIYKLMLIMREEIFTSQDEIVTKEKVLAYLEKQKDRMTAEEFESSELFQLKLKTKYANGYQDGLAQKEPENVSASTMIPSCWAEEPSLQKEQKPNSTEDMPYITDEHFYEREPADSFKYKLAEYMTKNSRKEESPDGYTYHISAETILKMAEEELLKRGVVQKPAEWSEEDESIRKAILGFLNPDKGGTKYSSCAELVKWSDWLKSLRPQPKVEWTEEEENMMMDILTTLRIECVEGDERYQKLARFLESLRPSWKPREVQKYDEYMDKECIKLCDILNSIPTVDTFESCCGHLRDRYSVWFFCNDIITISRLGRCVERNYSDGKWELLVDSTDTHPTGVFWLRSKEPFQSYDEMEKSVNGLCNCIQHWLNTKFDSYFNGNSGK